MLQPCGVAKLYSAIFEIPLTQSYTIVGLECCPRCNKASTKPSSYPFCSEKCRRILANKAERVELVCDTCGKGFIRKVSEIVSNARVRERKGMIARGLFCSRQCHGKAFGREAGFGAHPENNGSARRAAQTHCKYGHPFDEANTYWIPGKNGRVCKLCSKNRRNAAYEPHPRQSKYDGGAIWAAHLETGYGSVRLTRLLGIPHSAIDKVLAEHRRPLTPAPGPDTV